VAKIFELTDRGARADASVLMNSFDDQAVQQMISGLLASEDLLVVDKKKMHHDCIQRIKQERSRSHRKRIMQQMADAQRDGDGERLQDLTLEFNQLIKGTNG